MKNFIKKAVAGILTAAIAAMNFIPAFTVSAEESQTLKVHNLVLFAQFPNEDANYNFMSDKTEKMLEFCEAENTTRSFKGYINEISYGQMNVDFVFPQLKDNLITPYTMKKSQSEYTNAELMITELVSNAKIPENAELDGNNDGVADNIIVVFDSDSKSASSIFWPRAISLPGIDLNGTISGMVNLHNSYSLFESFVSGGAGVLCHEFLHSMGYPDLYRNSSREGAPVGLWDIMSSDSIYLQYPLAYMRYSVSGWLDAETITKSGTYELLPASEKSGKRLYLIKTPMSDTEFFAVEFRQKGKAYSNDMDEKIYGSGLVVYRVNTEIRGNYKENGDQIYVFRPEETGLDAGFGDLHKSNYGGENAPDSVGSLDLTDTFADNALVYSNGTNSGIKLSDITINDDKLSFKVDFADLADFDTWKSMPVPDGSISADSLDIEISNNTPYLLTDTKNGTAVFSYENDEWKAYTTELPEKAYNAKLIMNGNTPYVLYNDSQFFFTIRYYEDGNWKFLLKGSEVNQYQDFCIYNNKIYLAYTTGSFPYQLHLLSYDLLTGDSENYVNGSGDVCNISIAANKNGVAVSYRGTEDTSPFVDIWKSRTEKETIKLSDENSGITKIVSDENKFYVTSTEKSAGLYTIENGESEKTDFSEINGNIFFAEPFMCENDLYVTLNTQNPDDLSVYKVVNNKLEKVRNSILSETVNNSVSCAGQNAIYTAYISLSGNIAIKKIDLKNSSENIIGDVNKDNIFNIADIVTLQKYILNQEISTFDYKSADINSDNKINVIDLALLKEKISE